MPKTEVMAFNKSSGHMCTERSACRSAPGTGHTDLQTQLTRLKDALDGLKVLVDARKRSDPFEGREVVGLFVTPGGQLVKQIRDEKDDGQEFAEPTSPWSANLDGPQSIEQRFPDAQAPEGDPHGDPKIERRRRATELERQIIEAKKQRDGASVPDKLRWDQELYKLNAELESIRAAERAEREQLKTF